MTGAGFLLMFVVVPVWIAAGLCDYFCHRATRIQDNSGTPESLLHLLQFSLVGAPVALAMILERNAGFLLFALSCIFLHHLVAYIDVRYADARRPILPREQMVHSFLEIMPITAFLLLAAISWPQLLALFGAGTEPARFTSIWQPLPAIYVIPTLATAFLFNLVPYLEELWRCIESADAR